MGFEALLGNDRLKQNLSTAVSRGRISHFYLISGPEGSGKKTLTRLLAAAALCKGGEKPCMTCAHCRKIMAGTHPDMITVDDPERRYVPIELVRKTQADLYIQPNEGDRKIYVFPRAQDMLIPSQNALLKILEEPPSYGLFLLLTDSGDKLLPTIRSRCTELEMTALPKNVLETALKKACPQAEPIQIEGAISRSGGYLGQAIGILEAAEDFSQTATAFAESFAARDALGLVQLLVPMEKWKRDAFAQELDLWIEILANALAARNGIAVTYPVAEKISRSRAAGDIMQAIDTLRKAAEYARRNVSVAAVCGFLGWELR